LGVKVFPAIFEDVGPLDGRLIPVKKRGSWGYSDPDVNLAIPYRYSFVSNFRNSVAIASIDDLYGVIDTLGKVIIPFQYTALSWMDTLLVAQDSAVGIISIEQDTLVSFEYEEIVRLDNNVVQLKRTSPGFDYFDLRLKRFLRREENRLIE
jgi:hypothetical protein